MTDPCSPVASGTAQIPPGPCRQSISSELWAIIMAMEGFSVQSGGALTANPNGLEHYVDVIWAQSDSVALMYLEGERLGQPMTREQKQFIEGIIAADYDGRTVIELLQNGHDAHERDATDGKLAFVVDERLGPYGTLYVANAGSPVSDQDFRDMCRIAMSEKRPDEGIGNKGVGFKSVLQLAESPEVYSAAIEGSPRFDGYRFRFARAEDFDTVAGRLRPDEPGFGAELRENVSSLKMTLPIPAPPEDIEDFARRGYSTVIRLELRSAGALDAARRQLDELASSDVPINLFLPRLATITITTVTDSGRTQRTLTHHRTRVDSPTGVEVHRVDLQDGETFVVLDRVVPEQAMLSAIQDARSDSRLNAGWDNWKGDARVSVALPTNRELEHGRTYTFLPMDPAAGAMLPAFVNAPFFARLDRRSLDSKSPLNRLLLDEIAQLCVDALLHLEAGTLELPGHAVLDLLTFDTAHLPRLRDAFTARSRDLAHVAVVPTLGRERRTAVADCWIWIGKGKAFSARRVARAGHAGILDPAVGAHRTRRLSELATALKLTRRPLPADLADFAETYAASLAARGAQPRAWSAFVDDLAAELPNGSVLRGRRILLDSDGHLSAANDPGSDGHTVYFLPSATVGSPPSAVKQRVAFLHSEVARTRAGRRAPAGRDWLDSQRLVREYRTDTILELVGATMRHIATRRDDGALRECLTFAYRIWRDAKREVSTQALAGARLLVPTVTGWKPATDTVFGPGWGGPFEDTDTLLAQLLERAALVSDGLARVADNVLGDPHSVVQTGLDQPGDVADLRRFCEELGASHGLVPGYFPRSAFEITGGWVAHPDEVTDRSVAVPHEQQKAWRRVAAQRRPASPYYKSVTYRPDTDVAYLPGQLDWANFDHRSRIDYVNLILRGLDTWPDSALEYRYVRANDPARPAWPTFLTAFLATADWVPQTTPGDRTTVDFIAPAQAWWLREEQTPDYLPAQPNTMRALATPVVLQRLSNVGVRFWDDPDTADDRLTELTTQVAQRGSRLTTGVRNAVRKAYEKAWADLCDSAAATTPHTVIVSTQGQYSVTDLDYAANVVYVGERSGGAQHRLLSQTCAQLLPVRDLTVAGRVLERLRADGVRTARGTSEATVVVEVDGLDASSLPPRPLHDWGGGWLDLLVAAVVEFRFQDFPPLSDDKIGQARRQIRNATVVVGRQLTPVVDGHAVPSASAGQSYLVTDPATRIVVATDDDVDRWAVLQASSEALAQLIELPTLAGEIKLALITLERHHRTPNQDPTTADLAAAVGVTGHDIEALRGTHREISGAIERLIPVLACLDFDTAEQLAAQAGVIEDQAALRVWLDENLPAGVATAATVLELAEQEDLLHIVRQLNVPLNAANRGLRALGLAPLHNAAGHHQQFRAYLAREHDAIQDELRDRFRDTHAHRRPLDGYLRLQDLPGLAPDPRWLEQHWDLTDDLVAEYVKQWLDTEAPHPTAVNGAPLPSVEELRKRGRRTVNVAVVAARPLVEAWLHRNAAGAGPRPQQSDAVIAAVVATGLMDFGVLRRGDVLQWLADNGQWPAAMPVTTRLAELDLTSDDIDEARQRLKAGHDQARRKAAYVTYGTQTFGTEPEELIALADAVRDHVPAALLVTAPIPLLAELAPLPPADDGLRGGGGGGPWRAPTHSPEKTKAIGLAGEIVASRWIEHHYGLPPEVTWKSGYRHDVLADGKGDDRLGYDFEVLTEEGKIFYEVKATVDDTPQFALGESEVRRAGELADGERYGVLFVTHVLDPERQRIHPLPNPLGPGMRYFHLAGRSMRLQFALARQ